MSSNYLLEKSGVYVIYCLANGSCYLGSADNIKKRISKHLSDLKLDGASESPLFKHDWNKHGSDQFVLLVRYIQADERLSLEKILTIYFKALEDDGGYNKQLANGPRSPCSRIRDTEKKLISRRKYILLKECHLESRIHADFIRTFCQSGQPINNDWSSLKERLKLKFQYEDVACVYEFEAFNVAAPDNSNIFSTAATLRRNRGGLVTVSAGVVPVHILSSLDKQVRDHFKQNTR